MNRKLLPIAISLLLPSLVHAQEIADSTHAHDEPKTLEAIQVTATPLGNAIDDLARPVEVLSGPELDQRKAGTLGETLSRETGVQSSFFGAGVGRPVIRGQEGARVQVLSGGTGAMDASTVSADHAVSIEPFLADQIEVLKGPASLLFGSGAIGGAVNVVDGRIPTTSTGKALTGRAELRHGSGSSANVGVLRLDGDAGRLTWHLDAFRRSAGDYRIPGFAFSPSLVAEEIEEGEDPDHFASRRQPNSALDTEGGALGASWLGERGWFGAAISSYRSQYGIPPGAHEHHGDEEESDRPAAFALPLEEEGEEEGEIVRIDLAQSRFDSRGGLRDVGPFKEINFRYSRNDYRHFELEGEEIGTRFDNEADEFRLEAVQRDIGGWRGAFGLQWGQRDFRAVGAEAFLPGTDSRDIGVFVLQERDFGAFKLEAGARHDRVRIRPDDGRAAQSRDALSLSLGGLWTFGKAWHLSVGLDRAQRAPTAEELFSDGAHIATGSYELGNSALRSETARNAEIGLHLHAGRLSGKISTYRTGFDDFIYLADTGSEQDGLPLRRWTQSDARFRGWEAELAVEIADNGSGLWSLRAYTDRVDARLAGGARLPRIVPARVGLDLDWENQGWRARLGVVNVSTQDDVAAFESATPGHTLVDAHLSYHWDSAGAGWEAFLDGRNLTDREARVHTSFLKDVAPLPGRSLEAGLRVFF